jgi:hypothetical protein
MYARDGDPSIAKHAGMTEMELTHTERALERVQAYVRRHNLTPYQLSLISSVPYRALLGILDDDFSIASGYLHLLEVVALTVPKPEVRGKGNPIWRLTRKDGRDDPNWKRGKKHGDNTAAR